MRVSLLYQRDDQKDAHEAFLADPEAQDEARSWLLDCGFHELTVEALKPGPLARVIHREWSGGLVEYMRLWCLYMGS